VGKLKTDWKQEGTTETETGTEGALYRHFSLPSREFRQALGKMLKYLRRITEQMEVKILSYCARRVGVLNGDRGSLVSDLRICFQFNKNRYDKIYFGVTQLRYKKNSFCLSFVYPKDLCHSVNSN
jgi:hypothetical protein